MPKKKTLSEPNTEQVDEAVAVIPAEDAAMPQEDALPDPVPEELPAPEQADMLPEQETGETVLPEDEEGAGSEILSVEPDPSPTDEADPDGEASMPEELPGGLWADESGDASDWGQTPISEVEQPLDGKLPAPAEDTSAFEESAPALEETPAGEAEPIADAGSSPAAEGTSAGDEPAEPDPTPRRRTARRTKKADAETKQAGEPAAAEGIKGKSEQPSSAEENGRRSFYELDFHALDRDLSPEQRQEWNSIYASYRGRSVLTGSIAGVDPHTVRVRDKRTGAMVRKTMYCATVILFRVRILIPSTEMWMPGEERPDFVLRNMSGASIDFVVTHVDREAGFAIASRRTAMRSRRYYFSTQPSMNTRGTRIKCRVLAVGPRRCLVECGGYDIDLTQREMRYTAIPDLRDQYKRGEELDCIVKNYDKEKGRLVISVKETNPNPFDGAELRHPEGSRRQAEIAGKYAGGVFCNLPDGVVIMCSYSFHYDDAAFAIGDKVIVLIQHYDLGKKQIYGKIVAKW